MLCFAHIQNAEPYVKPPLPVSDHVPAFRVGA